MLPEALIRVDAALYAASLAADPSRLLNPLNVAEAQAAFFAGQPEPPFVYADARDVATVAKGLQALRIPVQHAFGPTLKRAVQSFARMAQALHARTADAFDDWSQAEGWERGESPTELGGAGVAEPKLSGSALFNTLERALSARKLNWQVVWDPVMSARVLVEASRREIRVNPRAQFRASDAKRLIAHEIDVHVARAEAGHRQTLRIFETGLPGALQTEEGLAVLAEERVGLAAVGLAARHQVVLTLIQACRETGFREAYEVAKPHFGDRGGFGVILRLKRGLADPGKPGVYAKDAVYGFGATKVRQYVANGGDVNRLYVGKVGVEDPVGDWLSAGLIQPGRAPQLWALDA